MIATLSTRRLLRAATLALAVVTNLPAASSGQEEAPVFERDVFPILKAHCLKCHGLEGYTSDLDLRTVPFMLRGGKHGAAIVRGSANESALYRRIVAAEMPPGQELKLTDEQVATIRRWIDAGAPAIVADDLLTDLPARPIAEADRDFWAFRPFGKQQPPSSRQRDRSRTAIDAFLLEKLDANSLDFSPDADRLTLLRRAHFDLIGLPPSPQEIESFLAADSLDAYDRLIDRLLASPHFGERWGRHWLDAAGYVDVTGGDNDAGIIKLGSGKWLYRDYVVRAFNNDKPFDSFLREQLAGDELVNWREASEFTPQIKELLIATGFLRTAADDTDENELNTADIRHAVLQRTVEVAASNLLAITLNCAKCHDHKYDPILQRDYYQLQAIFAPAFNPQSWLQPKVRALADVAPTQRVMIEQHNAGIAAKVEDLKKRLSELHRPYEERLFEQKLSDVPEPIRTDTKVAIHTPGDKRTEVQKYLASKFDASLKVSAEEVVALLNDSDRPTDTELKQQIADLGNQRRGWGDIQAVYDVGPPMPTYLLRRGNHETPGLRVDAGFLTVLHSGADHATSSAQGAPANGLCADFSEVRNSVTELASSGRRLALARTLTDWNSPSGALVARVQVNRIWQHLFGRGIVETSDNFGQSGARPTHPELLEWLAQEFVGNGGRFKPLIKTVMSSTAYRQSSSYARSNVAEVPPIGSTGVAPADLRPPNTVDPDNHLLWHQRLRRLESEIVRDSLLAVSGELDNSFAGPPIPIESRPDGTVVVKRDGPVTAAATNRRSIYLLARRNYHPTLLAVFDQPPLPTNCTTRTSSAVVSQALTMLNDEFVREQAERFAARVAATAENSLDQGIEMAFRIALGRSPTAMEREWTREFLNSQTNNESAGNPETRSDAIHRALVSFCQIILNTSEFLYVE